MDAHIKKVYVPMTEHKFLYIVMSPYPESRLWDRTEGKRTDSIMKWYSSGNHVWKSFEDGERWSDLFYQGGRQEENLYEITELGTEVLELELKRIRRLYRNAQEVTK